MSTIFNIYRVQAILGDGKDHPVIDPTSDGQYLKRKRKLEDQDAQQDSQTQHDISCPKVGWTQDLSDLPEFTEINIRTHLTKSGKTVKHGKVLSKPDKRGISFSVKNI